MVNVLSKERMGREPLRQLPGKWSSDMVCTVSIVGAWREVRNGRGYTVLQMHLHGRAVWRFTYPYVEVFSFPRFEE